MSDLTVKVKHFDVSRARSVIADWVMMVHVIRRGGVGLRAVVIPYDDTPVLATTVITSINMSEASLDVSTSPYVQHVMGLTLSVFGEHTIVVHYMDEEEPLLVVDVDWADWMPAHDKDINLYTIMQFQMDNAQLRHFVRDCFVAGQMLYSNYILNGPDGAMCLTENFEDIFTDYGITKGVYQESLCSNFVRWVQAFKDSARWEKPLDDGQ